MDYTLVMERLRFHLHTASWHEYLQSVQRLSELAPTTLLTSHYPVMRDKEVRAFLEKTRVFTERLQEELLRQLGSSSEAMSALQLAENLSPLLGPGQVRQPISSLSSFGAP